MDLEQFNLSEKEKQELQERADRKLAAEIMQDFDNRREARRSLESGWLLNMNFFRGNQYCDISPFGGVTDEDKQFYWQSRRVFNHIAPTIDARLAKLERLRPQLNVRAFSDEDGDLQAAKLASGVLKYAQERVNFSETVTRATVWSEICGCVFYKVLWNEKGGKIVARDENGLPMYEGEVSITAVSPFEIYPDKLNVEDMNEVESLIHARAVSSNYIYERFGVEVAETELFEGAMVYSQATAAKLPLSAVGMARSDASTGVILIERYTKPNNAYPHGRLEIVAGGKLLYQGELPYKNGERSERLFPFVKQDCMRLPAAFFGVSMVDRLIPVQRAYNAVRNRKHEFLNRLSLGVLTVEDGSVDTEELSEEGLLPGKVLVYRQGGKAPEMLDCGNIPSEFAAEEEWLEREFSMVGGISEVADNATPIRVTSASGLKILLAQDEARLSATLFNIERAIKEVGRQVLRLYRQFAGNARLMRLTGENKRTQVHYFNASDLSVSDLQFDTTEVVSPEDKKETLLRLYEAGVLTDEQGKLSSENKQRILDAFGFGSYENARDISALHVAKAGEENLDMQRQDVDPDEYDEHDLHITEHTRYLLSAELKTAQNREELKKRFVRHIAIHKKMKKQEIE